MVPALVWTMVPALVWTMVPALVWNMVPPYCNWDYSKPLDYGS